MTRGFEIIETESLDSLILLHGEDGFPAFDIRVAILQFAISKAQAMNPEDKSIQSLVVLPVQYHEAYPCVAIPSKSILQGKDGEQIGALIDDIVENRSLSEFVSFMASAAGKQLKTWEQIKQTHLRE